MRLRPNRRASHFPFRCIFSADFRRTGNAGMPVSKPVTTRICSRYQGTYPPVADPYPTTTSSLLRPHYLIIRAPYLTGRAPVNRSLDHYTIYRAVPKLGLSVKVITPGSDHSNLLQGPSAYQLTVVSTLRRHHAVGVPLTSRVQSHQRT